MEQPRQLAAGWIAAIAAAGVLLLAPAALASGEPEDPGAAPGRSTTGDLRDSAPPADRSPRSTPAAIHVDAEEDPPQDPDEVLGRASAERVRQRALQPAPGPQRRAPRLAIPTRNIVLLL